MNVPERLRKRGAPLVRLPQPEAPEDDMDMAEKHTFSGDDLARMLGRMGRALRRLGLRPGAALALAPEDTLEHMMLWLAALVHGHDVLLLAADAKTVPNSTGAIICPPDGKAHWQPLAARAGVKLATLGGHWEGSFFMLQMVQPEHGTMPWESTACSVLPDGGAVALSELLQRAEAFRKSKGMDKAPALLASFTPWWSRSGLQAMLAMLLTPVPLYWLPPALRGEGLAALPDALPQDAWLLGDAAFLEQAASAAGVATRLHGGRRLMP